MAPQPRISAPIKRKNSASAVEEGSAARKASSRVWPEHCSETAIIVAKAIALRQNNDAENT
jgi:hypothetical protein